MHGPVVRKGSKDHGLRSEASARFEKGVDPARVREAGERAARIDGTICWWYYFSWQC